MSVNIVLILIIGVLIGTGVYLVLERSLTRVLVGLILMGNGVNLMFMVAAGEPGESPIIVGDPATASLDTMSDPLPQAMVLTAIVITLGMTAFLLAMAYRSWQLNRHDEVADDVEDRRIARLAEESELTMLGTGDDIEDTDETTSDEVDTSDELFGDSGPDGSDLPDPDDDPGSSFRAKAAERRERIRQVRPRATDALGARVLSGDVGPVLDTMSTAGRTDNSAQPSPGSGSAEPAAGDARAGAQAGGDRSDDSWPDGPDDASPDDDRPDSGQPGDGRRG